MARIYLFVTFKAPEVTSPCPPGSPPSGWWRAPVRARVQPRALSLQLMINGTGRVAASVFSPVLVPWIMDRSSARATKLSRT